MFRVCGVESGQRWEYFPFALVWAWAWAAFFPSSATTATATVFKGLLGCVIRGGTTQKKACSGGVTGWRSVFHPARNPPFWKDRVHMEEMGSDECMCA